MLRCCRHGDTGIGEGGAADDAEQVHAQGQELLEAESCRDGLRRSQLACLGALAVAEVQRVGVEVPRSERGADGGIHAAGKADDRLFSQSHA